MPTMRISSLVLAGALTAALSLTATDAPAGCSTGGLTALPLPNVALPANGRVVLQGSGIAEPTIHGLGDGALVLASEGDAVPLHVVEIQRGGWRVSQAILEPTRPLAPGARYTLRAAAQGSPLDEQVSHTWPARTWKAAHALTTGPRWTAKPSSGVPDIGRGCPPHVEVRIRVPIEGPERLLGVIAEVRPLMRSEKPSRFLLRVYDGEIILGHMGCEAPALLVAGATHLVTLTAVDLAGHEAPAPGGVFAVKGPS